MALERSFTNREEAKKEIHPCQWVGSIFQIVSLGFGVLGAIGDVLNITLSLESMACFRSQLFLMCVF